MAAPPGYQTRTHEPFCANFSFSIHVRQMTVQMKTSPPTNLGCLTQYCQNTRCYYFTAGFDIISPQVCNCFAADIYCTYDICIKRRPSFVHTKEGKMCLRSALRIPRPCAVLSVRFRLTYVFYFVRCLCL